MNGFLHAIKSVTGPLTLIAFLAVIVLAIFRRSVKDERGLEYVYNLFSDKLTKDHFYDITKRIIDRIFWVVLIIFTLSIAAFLITTLKGATGTQPSIDRPSPEKAIRPVTEGIYMNDENGLVEVSTTFWNHDPVAEVRITDFRLYVLKCAATAVYCCPEERSPVKLHLNKPAGLIPLSTTFAIPPHSSHSFKFNIQVERGIADNEPIVFFGLYGLYQTETAGPLEVRSDKLYYVAAENNIKERVGLIDISDNPTSNDRFEFEGELRKRWLDKKPLGTSYSCP